MEDNKTSEDLLDTSKMTEEERERYISNLLKSYSESNDTSDETLDVPLIWDIKF